jgi:hypothetical protein
MGTQHQGEIRQWEVSGFNRNGCEQHYKFGVPVQQNMLAEFWGSVILMPT